MTAGESAGAVPQAERSTGAPQMSDHRLPPRPEAVHVMLVSAHDWFASALQAVLEPEGFTFSRIRAARVALRDASQIEPDIVIIDEGLPDMEATDLASSLTAGALKPSVPILVYSPNFWHESEQAAAMRAGAWDIIKEPIRSNLVVAKLRRLLEIKQLIEATEEGALSDMSTGLLNLAGMIRMMRVLGATSRRHPSPLGCVVFGPTGRIEVDDLEAARALAARLCEENVRESDVCGWVGETEVGVVAYGTGVAGMASLMRRLTERAESDPEFRGLVPLSAGIIDLSDSPASEGSESPAVTPMASRIAGLSRVAAAQNALQRAREAGGGIRIAEAS